MAELKGGVEQVGQTYTVKLLDRVHASQVPVSNPQENEDVFAYVICGEAALKLKRDPDDRDHFLPSNTRIYCHNEDDPKFLPDQVKYAKFATITDETSIYYPLPDDLDFTGQTSIPENLKEHIFWLQQQVDKVDGKPFFVIGSYDNPSLKLAAIRFVQRMDTTLKAAQARKEAKEEKLESEAA